MPCKINSPRFSASVQLTGQYFVENSHQFSAHCELLHSGKNGNARIPNVSLKTYLLFPS